MKETSKAINRRLLDTLFLRAVRGKGLDIGAGKDPLNIGGEFGNDCLVTPFDLKDGDAQVLDRYFSQNYFDFIYSSHCLEHLQDVGIALKSWIRVLRPGGYGVIAVPDEDLYEQGFWPSKWAGEGHRHTFTIYKESSWSPVSINVTDLFIKQFYKEIKILSIKLVDTEYNYNLHDVDQTAGSAETSIEIIFRKES